jgi:hypothetical protein
VSVLHVHATASIAICAALVALAVTGCELVVGTETFTTESEDASAAGSSGSGDASMTKGGGPMGHDAGILLVDDSGSTEGGNAVLCATAAADSTCSSCWKTSCCGAYTACQGDVNCAKMATCIENCTDPPCDCTAPAASMQIYLTLASCGVVTSASDPTGTSPCALCEAVGTGDPCVWDYNCVGSQVNCMSDGYCAVANCPYWCSPATCSSNSDCAGNYANATSQNGLSSACIDYDGFGDTMCFPECSPSNANSCAAFPDTTCTQNTDTDGNSVYACE